MIKSALSLLGSTLLIIFVLWYVQQQTGYDVSEEGMGTYVINQTAETLRPIVSDPWKQALDKVTFCGIAAIGILGVGSLFLLILKVIDK